MAIINKATVTQSGEVNRYIITVELDSVNFWSDIIRDANITHDTGITFDNDGSYWKFWVDNESDDAFRVKCHDKKKSNTLKINSRPLSRMILKSTGKPLNSRFYVQKTTHRVDGKPVYEILTHKTVDELMENVEG
jgi:hypothetical protein